MYLVMLTIIRHSKYHCIRQCTFIKTCPYTVKRKLSVGKVHDFLYNSISDYRQCTNAYKSKWLGLWSVFFGGQVNRYKLVNSYKKRKVQLFHLTFKFTFSTLSYISSDILSIMASLVIPAEFTATVGRWLNAARTFCTNSDTEPLLDTSAQNA